jgi:hypothetical protein
MLVDITPIKYLNESKTCVTVSHEAFARLLFQNCREKWLNTFRHKKTHGEKTPIPTRKDEPGYEKFQAKWSDRRNGQVKGGGWAEESRKVFINMMREIMKDREDDQKNGWRKHRYAKDLVRAKYEVTAETPPTTARKRRKRYQTVTPEQTLPEDVEDMPEGDE